MTIETLGWLLFAALWVVFAVVIVWCLWPTYTPKAERVRRKAFNSAEWTVRLATTLSSPDCVCDWVLYRKGVLYKTGVTRFWDKKGAETMAINEAWAEVWRIEKAESKVTVRWEILK